VSHMMWVDSVGGMSGDFNSLSVVYPESRARRSLSIHGVFSHGGIAESAEPLWSRSAAIIQRWAGKPLDEVQLKGIERFHAAPAARVP